MTKERLETLLQEALDWAFYHNEEFYRTFIERIGLTEEELIELDFEPIEK